MSGTGERRVAILLSTYNGATYLADQLESLLGQSHDNWVLYWRDDGSADTTVEVVERFAARAGQGRCVQLTQSGTHHGATRSFLSLLRAVAPTLAEGDAVAFADQDDVWLPDKIARGLAGLDSVAAHRPAVYCARQILVDATLNRIGLSAWQPSGPTGFPAALAQNVATGCTVMLNPAAARLVASSRPAPATLHDWWCYLLVTAAGGVLLRDAEPSVLYRQHATNAVGAPISVLRRGREAARRGPAPFMTVLRQHVTALLGHGEMLTETARSELDAIAAALSGGWRTRLPMLALPGLRRQTLLETLVFRVWFLLG